ncbi:MAG: acetyltransferase family [Clostridia bacterium]|jgi:hypothetical protein|nr:acetyltransferase family [Clostridia bacterium]
MKVGESMCKIISVQASDDYKLMIGFESGSSIIFNMQKIVKTIPYLRLKDQSTFKRVKCDGKSVYWDAADGKEEYMPLRLSVDAILFSLRD